MVVAKHTVFYQNYLKACWTLFDAPEKMVKKLLKGLYTFKYLEVNKKQILNLQFLVPLNLKSDRLLVTAIMQFK